MYVCMYICIKEKRQILLHIFDLHMIKNSARMKVNIKSMR